MAVSNGRITGMGKVIGVNNDGDLQVMFGSSQKSKAWYFNPANTHLNVMALNKPFDYNGTFTLDAAGVAARLAANRSVRCGFGSIPTISPSTFQTAKAQWVYNSPDGTPGHPRRAHDFEGYNKYASAPLLLVMDEQYTAGQAIRVRILTNHRVDDEPGYNFEWADNVTIEELLMDSRNSNNYVHLFIKKTSGTGAGTLNIVILEKDYVGTAMSLTDLAPNSAQRGTGVEGMFYLYPNGDGGNCPAIPVLQNAVSGDTFDVCAAFGTIPDGVISGYYKVYTSIPSMTWYSLNLNGSNNQASFSMTQLVNNVSGSISYVLLQATSDYFTDQYDNHYRKFIIKAIRASITTGPLYTGGAVSMNFRLAMDGSEGTMTGFIGVIRNNEIAETDQYGNSYSNFTETFSLQSNQSYTEYFCDESAGFTDRYFWALWGGDPDDTYQLGVACTVIRQSYPNVSLAPGSSNVVHFND